MEFNLKIWRQKNAKDKGHFETYHISGIEEDASFLEMLDILNEQLIREGMDPVAVDKGCQSSGPVSFDHDCREGICGACSLYIDGRAHGPDDHVTTCQLFMRHFKDGATITVEPFRSPAFPIIKDLVVDRRAYDKILQAGGFIKAKASIPRRTSFENFKTFLYLLKKVHKKKYVLLGSTDVLKSNGLDKDFYYKEIRKSCLFHPKKPNFVFKKKGYTFIAMDGSKQYFQGTNGYYSEDELRWLDETLSKHKKENVIIIQHFPILKSNSQWLTTAKVEGYYEVLKKYDNVKIIISGHYGNNLETTQDNIVHIITEGYNKNRAYKIIQIDLKLT